jgi:predicted nucleotidyltransferase
VDTATSDIDLLVDLEEGVGLLDLIGLERELSELLGVDVDVVPAATLKPRIRARVLAEAIPL